MCHGGKESFKDLGVAGEVPALFFLLSLSAPTLLCPLSRTLLKCALHGGGMKVLGLGLFPLVSMLNHARAFNCRHRFEVRVGHTPELVIYAVRAIAVGEECCYSYVSPALPRAEQNALLKAGYGFEDDGE